MKTTLFQVWFSDGRVTNTQAYSPNEAVILTQSEAINDGYGYYVDSVRNEETGQVYNVKTPMVLETVLKV